MSPSQSQELFQVSIPEAFQSDKTYEKLYFQEMAFTLAPSTLQAWLPVSKNWLLQVSLETHMQAQSPTK